MYANLINSTSSVGTTTATTRNIRVQIKVTSSQQLQGHFAKKTLETAAQFAVTMSVYCH